MLTLSDDSLSISLGITNQFSRESLLLSIEELREKEKLEPRNFHEFRVREREGGRDRAGKIGVYIIVMANNGVHVHVVMEFDV